MSALNPARVRELFEYEDGALIWRETQAPRARAGAIAGTRDKSGQHAIRIKGTRYLRARLVWAWHHGAWPEHDACHADLDCSNDNIDNLLDLAPPERRQLQRNKQRTLPVGVAHARHGHNYTARRNALHLGSYKTVAEAQKAYEQANLAAHANGLTTNAV